MIPDFGLTPEEIAQDPVAIYLSAVPITWTGRETVYVDHLGPRSKFALDQLRDSVLKYRTAPETTAAE